MNALQTFRSLPKKTIQALLILFITALFFWISLTVLLPTLPAYLDDIGANRQQLGWIMGCFAIGLIVSRRWLGNLVDNRSRKLVILIGTIVVATAPLGYFLFDSFPVLMVIRAYHGISVAAFTTAYSTLVVDLSPVKQRGEIVGYMSLAVPIGMGLGPALGSFLEDTFNYDVLFLFSILTGLIASLLALQIKDVKLQEKSTLKADTNQLERSFWQLLRSHAFVVPTIVFFLVGILFGGLVTFLPLFIRDHSLPFSAGLFYSYAALASFLGRILTGRASDRYGRGVFVTVSLICYGLSMFLLTIAVSTPELIIAASLEGLGGGIVFPVLISLLSDRSYPHERGKVYAICIGGYDVGVALAGPILGIIEISYTRMFLISSGLAVIALIIFFIFSNKTPASSLRFAWGLEKDRYSLN